MKEISMRYLFTSLLLILLLCTISYSQNKSSIAVLELEAGGISAYEAQVLSNRLRTELFKTDRFTVLERDKMDEILIEQGFQLSGCTTNDCVVEAGKLIGVEQMVAGNIAKIDNFFTIDIRLIDVETGKVVKTATEDCECALKDVLTNSIRNVARSISGLKTDEQVSTVKKYLPVNTKDDKHEQESSFNNSFGIGIRTPVSGDLSGNIFFIEYMRKLGKNVSFSIGLGLGTHYKKIEEIGGSNSHTYEPTGKEDLDFILTLDYWFIHKNNFTFSAFVGYALGGDRYKYSLEYHGNTEIISNNDLNSYRALPFGISMNYITQFIGVNGITLDLGYFVDLTKFQKAYPYNGRCHRTSYIQVFHP